MRIVFFGTPAFAVPSLEALIAEHAQIVGVVTQPDKPQGRSRSTLVPPPVKEQVYRRLWEVLEGRDTSESFAHLSANDRQNIREILTATKSNLPNYWRPEGP